MTTQIPASPPGGRRPFRLLLIGICVGAALFCLAIGFFVLDRTMRARRDRQTIEWAKQAMKQGRYEEAAAQFQRAVSRHPDDADLSLQSGDAFYALSASKPEALQRARIAWQSAARINPNDVQAVQRLLQFQIDLAEVRPSAKSFRELGEAAQNAISILPSDKQAQTARLIAMLGPWFSQAGSGTAWESQSHEKTLNSLADLVSQRPADDLAILYYALASARRSVELRLDGDATSAHQILDRAEHQIADAAGPESKVLYRAAEGLAVLAEANRRVDQIPASSVVVPLSSRRATTQPALAGRLLWPAWDMLDHTVRWDVNSSDQQEIARAALPSTRPVNAAIARCRDEARAIAARAATSMQPSDGHFIDIRLLEVHLAEQAGDLTAAERICRETLSARPGDLRTKLALAELVSESHPDQAIAILEQPDSAQEAVPGPVALNRRELIMRAAKQTARLYLDAATSATDPAVRQANMQKASVSCDALAAMLVTDAASSKLTGRLRMLQGRYTDAIRLLDRAASMDDRKVDIDLLTYRATTLLALRESQPAIDCLRRVLQLAPSRSGERFLLARTLMEQGRLTEADKQVSILEQQLAQDPGVLELRVQWLVSKTAADPDNALAERLQEAYAKLPEASVEQKLAKAELALSAANPTDAIRLLQAVRAADPSSLPAALALARAMIADKHSDGARALLAEIAGQHPNDPSLLAAQKSVDGPPSTEAYEASLAGANVHQFLDAVHSFRAALEAHDLARANIQIQSMTQLRPQEPLLDESKFRYDLATQQWGDAALCADRLARSNFDGVEGLSYEFQLNVARAQPLAAVGVGRQLTARHPQLAAGWLDYGQALAGIGRDEQAIGSFRRALEIEANNAAAIKGLSRSLQQLGQMSEADQWIAKGLRVAPSDPNLREMAFARQLSQGDPHRLEAERKAAIRREPERPDNVIALARVYLRINALETISNPQAAHDAMAKAVELLNGAVKKWPDDKDCSFWDAHAAALGGDVAGGKQILRRLCDQTSWAMRPEAEQLLADYCLIWGDPRSAEGALRTAMARGGRGASVAERLSAVLMQLGSWQAALDALNEYRDDPEAQQLRITIIVAGGRGNDLEKQLKNGLLTDPTNPGLAASLGLLYSIWHKDAEAKRWLDQAIAEGDEELAREARAGVNLRDKPSNPRQAIEDLTIAQERNPSASGTALLLRDACVRDHDLPGAARALKTALAIAPSEKTLRLGLVELNRAAAIPDWDQIADLIEEGRSLAPSDWTWDVCEARMWSSRHELAKAAALIRRAVLLAQTNSDYAAAAMESQDAWRVRELIPEELWMLLEAQAYDTVIAQSNEVISHYGSRDMLSALAHHAKASVQRRTGSGDGGAAEYLSALETAQAAGGFQAASTIVETISSDAGADEAIRRIDAYLASITPKNKSGSGLSHDARWDLLRIDLLRRNHHIEAAAQEIDKLMPHLTELPDSVQIQLLRTAVVVYLQAPSTSQSDKAGAACLALLHRLPDDIWALNNMASICIDHSHPAQPQNAIEYGQRAYAAAGRLGDVDPHIVDTYGWALAAAGRSSEAIQMLKPIAARLNMPEGEYHLAEAYLAVHDPLSAWPHLVSALRLIQRDEKQGQGVDPSLRRGVANAYWQALRQMPAAAFESCIVR